jgi:nickel/cobalt transporter (NicO) family protein
MRIIALFTLGIVATCAIWLWGFDGADLVSRWAASVQRDVQNAMAGSLRALRAGEAGALLSLWTLCLTYGFVHAAGPGHGKLVLGGYALGVRVTARRLAGLAALSSVAQALVAIVFVTVALTLLGWGRAQMTDVADKTMAPLSYALVSLVGLWLAWRGLRKLWRQRPQPHIHDHLHDHDVCNECGHAHAPSVAQVEAVRTWRDVAVVVGAIAIRPCTGAVFLLIMTYALDVYWVGIVGVLVMGIGTAALTALVAFAAAGARESAVAQAASAKGTATLLAIAELGAGVMIAAVAMQLLMRFL